MSTALYNELDPFAAQWLRNLSERGHIARGDVDERSISDLRAVDVAGSGQRHFFAGIGVWSYGLRLAGVPDSANIWTGSCPCQPFSGAGLGGGFDDARHLWPVWFGLISECRPAIIFGEQVASPDGLAWLDLVYADLEGAGYAVGSADLCAAGVGAPHIRQRLFFVAHSNDARPQGWSVVRNGSNQRVTRPRRVARDVAGPWSKVDWVPCSDGKARPVEPGTFPLAHGSPNRVGRLRAYGNGLASEQVATFIRSALT